MSPERPVFVVGCPRSGTTLLTLMLSRHPRIAIPPETRFLLPVFRDRHSFGDLGDLANRRLLARRMVRRGASKFGHLGLDPKRVRRVVARSSPTIGSALAVPFRLYAADRGKARWGDKRPSYFRNIALLRALFPGAQFVHLVRDPRDCVGSLKRMGWWQHGVPAAVATWVHAVDCVGSARRRLPPGVLYELRYEDLVAHPRSELERLCAFLGEDFDEAMLAPEIEAANLPARQRTGWHRETGRAIGTRRIGRYVEVLTPQEVALVEWGAGTRMREHGYRLADPDPDPGPVRPSTLDAARYLRTLTSMRLRTALLALRDRRLSHPAAEVAAR